MPFKLKTLNHSPQWYHDHCRAEDGGSPVFRAMLKNDMGFLDADNDSTQTYQEKIWTYEAKWNEVLSDMTPSNAGLQGEIHKVMERENADDFRPERQFESEPFTTIDQIMSENSLDAEVMRQFLNWKSRKLGAAKRKETIAAKKPDVVRTEDKFFS